MATDWPAIALAALRTEYPRLPDPLPAGPLADLVDVIAGRMEQATPGVTSQMIGAYSVVFSAGGSAVALTAMEAMLLRPYRRSRYKSVRTPTTVAREGSGLADERWDKMPDQADYLGVYDLEGDEP